ncbi:MAG: SGNH/GDSL hydrolase family protein [Thermodesulfobacteriota bacterium]|nr:SGNH/GDSL hydrolase family protein [Thermodesulfobacteriota bacterium]
MLLSDGPNVAQLLDQKLKTHNPKTKVINFGILGIESGSVKHRMMQALGARPYKPKLIILYYGHNDYNNPYTEIINQHFDSFSLFLRVAFLFSKGKLNFPDQSFVFNGDNYPIFHWYNIFNRPKILKLLQQMGLFSVKEEHGRFFDRWNGKILQEFKRNNEDIIRLAASFHIPLLLITPVANLHAEPYGSATTTSYYEKGVAATAYHDAIDFLTKAKDSEIFTGDVRAKSPLIDYIRTIEMGNVHILDLQNILIDTKCDFDGTCFLDYFHLTRRTHQIVADHIVELIVQNEGLMKRVFQE